MNDKLYNVYKYDPSLKLSKKDKLKLELGYDDVLNAMNTPKEELFNLLDESPNKLIFEIYPAYYKISIERFYSFTIDFYKYLDPSLLIELFSLLPPSICRYAYINAMKNSKLHICNIWNLPEDVIKDALRNEYIDLINVFSTQTNLSTTFILRHQKEFFNLLRTRLYTAGSYEERSRYIKALESTLSLNKDRLELFNDEFLSFCKDRCNNVAEY